MLDRLRGRLFSGIARATRHGVLIGGALPLVTLSACTAEIGSSSPGVGAHGPSLNGGAGSGGAAGGVGAEPPTQVAGSLPSSGLRRLTREQYTNAVGALLGEVSDATVDLPPDEVADEGFEFRSVGASRASTSAQQVQKYDAAATKLVGPIFASAEKRSKLLGCEPTSGDDACVSGFIHRFGQRAFRRPLASAEHERFLELVRAGAQTLDVWEGVEAAVVAFLTAPSFLYRVELGSPDPSTPGRLVLDDFELATRLAFLMLNSIPDDELLESAGRHELATPAGLAVQAERLLGSSPGEATLVAFFSEWLGLRSLEDLPKDPALFPGFNAGLARPMRGELEAFVSRELVRGEGNVLGMYESSTTYVDGQLAKLYGLEAPGGDGFQKVILPPNTHRSGILTFAGVLAANSRATMTSPTLRGRFVRERLLCGEIPPPPPDVNATLPAPPAPGVVETTRERLARHAEQPACAACHRQMDPLGLALEHFDAIGAYRELDQGRELDTSGELDGARFNDAAELGHLLATHPQAARCLVRQLSRHALGQLDTADESWIFERMTQDFEKGGHTLKSLVGALVSHDAFRFTEGLR